MALIKGSHFSITFLTFLFLIAGIKVMKLNAADKIGEDSDSARER